MNSVAIGFLSMKLNRIYCYYFIILFACNMIFFFYRNIDIKHFFSVFNSDLMWSQNDSCLIFLYMYNASQWTVFGGDKLTALYQGYKWKDIQNYYFVHDKNTMNIKAHKGYVHQKAALLEYDSKMMSSIVKLSGEHC